MYLYALSWHFSTSFGYKGLRALVFYEHTYNLHELRLTYMNWNHFYILSMVHNVMHNFLWNSLQTCILPVQYMEVPGWKGPRRLVVAEQNFALFSGFGVLHAIHAQSCPAAWWQWVRSSMKKGDNGISTVNEVCSGPRSRMLQPRFQRFECTQSWSDSMIL